jgi:TPP-dependent pyruvate/acetoin dehydrogenase alpha subunit
MDTDDALRLLRSMLRIRRFEERLIRLHQEGLFPGHYHVYIGQEATAVAVCSALRDGDLIFSTWRNHGHLLARGADPKRMMAEILGRASGYCGGKAGTLHLAAKEVGIPATSALVGGNIPLAVGAALALKYRRTGGIVVAFFGDGALEEGAFYEGMLLAALWKVPTLLVCENNSVPPHLRARGQYPSSVHPARQLVDVPSSFSIAAQVVDGTDLEQLIPFMEEQVRAVRAGEPRFVEVRTTRWPGSVPLWPELVGGETELGWAFGERPESEEYADWVELSDPVIRFLRRLWEKGLVTRERAERVDREVRSEIEEAVQFALASPFPEADAALAGVFARGC